MPVITDIVLEGDNSVIATAFDNYVPFIIAVYDDIHHTINRTAIDMNQVFDFTNPQVCQTWNVDCSGTSFNWGGNMLLEHNGYKVLYLEAIAQSQFMRNVRSILNIKDTGSLIYASKPVGYTPTTTAQTLTSALFFMTRPISTFFVRRKDLERDPSLIPFMFETAAYLGKTYYFDTGIATISDSWFYLQENTIASLYNTQNYLMYANLQMPIRTGLSYVRTSTMDKHYIFVTAGYVIRNSRTYLSNVVSQAYSNVGRITNISGNVYIAILPASYYYYNFVSSTYENEMPYADVYNKRIGSIDGGVDFHYKNDDATRNWSETNKINPLIYDVTNDKITLINNLTSYVATQGNNIVKTGLEEEGNSRLVLDIGRFVKSHLYSLIGQRETNQDDIKRIINMTIDELEREILSKAGLNKDSIKLQVSKPERNKLEISFYVKLYTTIKLIEITVFAQD
jgi:hypothetical protein